MRPRHQNPVPYFERGKWRARYYDENGCRRRVVLKANSKTAALKEIAAIIAPINVARAGEVKGPQMAFGAFVDRVYLPFARRKWKASTAITTEQRLRQHIIKGEIAAVPVAELTRRGIHVKRPNFKRGGVGVNQVSQQIPNLSGDSGASGRGIHSAMIRTDIHGYFEALSDRLRRVRVCCGDWARILGPSPTTKIGTTAVFLDPPYASDRDEVYAEESMFLAHEVCEWAIRHGDNPQLRIALCGYEGEHEIPSSWTCVPWKANGGYGNQSTGTRGRSNATLERVWFSPHCLKPSEVSA